jgi:predicted O-methyltransferase YrrM
MAERRTDSRVRPECHRCRSRSGRIGCNRPCHRPSPRIPGRCAIATVVNPADPLTTQALRFAETYVPEDPILATARSLAYEVGLPAISPGTGAALRLLAASGGAKAIVEIGTGTGVSGVWLLRGMRRDGVFTTIDVEAEHQRIARRIFLEAGFASSRTRIITGRALDVLPRLADGVYDLVFVDSEVTEFGACVAAAQRLLRTGGVLAVNGALAGGRIGDPAARDPETVAMREVVKGMREADEWLPALLPAGEGLLCAVRR